MRWLSKSEPVTVPPTVERVRREIAEALPRAQGDTAELLKKCERELAKIAKGPAGPDRLTPEQDKRVGKVNGWLAQVKVTDPMKDKTQRWHVELTELRERSDLGATLQKGKDAIRKIHS